MRRSRLFVAGLAVAVASASLLTGVAPVDAQTAAADTMIVQILGLNDFHGNIEPPSGSSGRIGTINAGGAEYLATHIRRLKEANGRTLIVHAGDLIGASPLLSAIFKDEPTIEIMRMIGLDDLGVGNHEFDKGVVELKRIAGGGCHPVEGCFEGTYSGATFPVLAANVVEATSGSSILPSWDIRVVDGVRIGIIGVTLESTPTVVAAAGVQGVKFLPEAVAINATAKVLKENYGVTTIIALIHEGVVPTDGDPNGCNGITGPIVDIVKKTTTDVDAFITGHTHQAYICTINGKPVTSASSFGRVITKLDLTISKSTGKVVSSTARNVIVTRDVPPAADISAYVGRLKVKTALRTSRVVGKITGDIVKAANPAGESALGNMLTDSQLAATAGPGDGNAVIAFTNPGGIRTDLVASQISGGEAVGDVTFGESFAVQPFGNNLVTISMKGADIVEALEQQFDNPAPGANRILSTSKGFTYTWTKAAPPGKKVSNVMLNGTALDPSASYRVTANSFLTDGGDKFPAFIKGTDRLGGVIDLDALEAVLKKGPVSPPATDRVTVV